MREDGMDSLFESLFKARIEGETDPAKIEKLKAAQEKMRGMQQEMTHDFARLKQEVLEEKQRMDEISNRSRGLIADRKEQDTIHRNETIMRVELHTNLINAIADQYQKS